MTEFKLMKILIHEFKFSFFEWVITMMMIMVVAMTWKMACYIVMVVAAMATVGYGSVIVGGGGDCGNSDGAIMVVVFKWIAI